MTVTGPAYILLPIPRVFLHDRRRDEPRGPGVRLRGLKLERSGALASAAAGVAERPFLEEMRAVEKLLPIPPDEINRRVLGTHLADADLDAAERLNAMNLRYYDAVVRPVLAEWTREVHARRAGQAWGFVASCAALVAGTFLHGTAAYVVFFVGTFGFCTAIAAWFGGAAANTGSRLAARLTQRASQPHETDLT